MGAHAHAQFFPPESGVAAEALAARACVVLRIMMAGADLIDRAGAALHGDVHV